MPLRIGVLMGGPSEERDVSIATGKAVVKACIENGFIVTEFSFTKNYKKYLKPMIEQDIIFNALHGGIGENGMIQSWLDKNDIKYTGSGALSSALCMNKAKSKDIAKGNGVITPEWQLIQNKEQSLKIKPPFVVKPNEQGSTVGLSIVQDDLEIKSAIEKAFQYGTEVIVEKYISGRELTIPILGSKAFPIVEIKPLHELYDYECKYTPGMSDYVCPAKLDNNIISQININTRLLFEAFGCNVYARADYILDHTGTAYFLEMNTLPGMTSTSLVPKSANATGITFSELISSIINLSL